MRISAYLIAHARKLATQAWDLASHYEHSEIGYNYRMSSEEDMGRVVAVIRTQIYAGFAHR